MIFKYGKQFPFALLFNMIIHRFIGAEFMKLLDEFDLYISFLNNLVMVSPLFSFCAILYCKLSKKEVVTWVITYGNIIAKFSTFSLYFFWKMSIMII